MAGVGGHVMGHVPYRLFQAKIVARRIDLGMGHAGLGLGRRLARLQPFDLGVAAQALDRRSHRLPAHQARGGVGRRFHHVRAAEHRLLARQMLRQTVETIGEFADRLARDLHLVPRNGGDQLLALGEGRGLAPPAPVADLGVVVVRLASPGQLVHSRQTRGVAECWNTELSRPRHDRLAPLRPVAQQILRHALDARELGVRPVLLHAHPETVPQVPGEIGAEHGARGLLPAVHGVLMVCPALAVIMGPGEVEDGAMDMELGIVLPAGAVGKSSAHQVRGHRPLDAVLGDTRIAAIAEHRVLQSRARGGHRHAFDLGPHIRLGDGPQRGDALVHREGHVDARGAFVAARPLHQLARAVGGEAVVKSAGSARSRPCRRLSSRTVRGG